MNVAREAAAATILNGYIYIAGGTTHHRFGCLGETTSVELYNPETDEWAKQTSTEVTLYKSTLIAANGFLFAMGGWTEAIERFKPYTNRWEPVCRTRIKISLVGRSFISSFFWFYFRLDHF